MASKLKQDTFDFGDDDEAAPAAVPATPKDAKTYWWKWGDAWPEGLTWRQYLMMQVARDRRAFDEEKRDEDQRAFYAGRIIQFEELLQKMNGDGLCPQQTQPAAAPGADAMPALSRSTTAPEPPVQP